MQRHSGCKFWASLAATLLAAALAAQAPSPTLLRVASQVPATAGQQTPVVRVTTRLVQVNVIVQDKKGEPVSDLSRDDFVLYDQAQQQSITLFSVESLRPMPGPAQPPPPNVFSNRFQQKAGVPTSVTLILLDGLNTRFEDMAYARQQLVKFLQQLQASDRVALYALTTRLRVLHDFTTDATRLLQALSRSQANTSHQLAASEFEPADTGDENLDAFLNEASQRIADFYTTNRVQTTAAALQEIANHVAGIPGRKNLVWVSGSFPFSIGIDDLTPGSARDVRTFSSEIEQAARALNNANLAIYPVDARGLIAPSFPTSATASVGSIRGRGGRFPQTIRMSPPHVNFDTMNILAERTGGRAFYNTNDIQGAIRRAIEDSRVTYVLGYYPNHNEWNGRFRQIKLEVKRPGLKLRHRRGYFALADRPPDENQRQALLRDAYWSPLDSTSIGLTVRVDLVDVPGAQVLKTRLQISPRDITLNQEGDRYVGELEIYFLQRGRDGKQKAAESRTISMRLVPATYQAVMKDGVVFERTLPFAHGAADLRVMILDTTSGAVGCVTIPLSRFFPAPGKS